MNSEHFFECGENKEELTRKTICQLKSLSLEEYTLLAKWNEIQNHAAKVGSFRVSKQNIFNPQSVEEILKTSPHIIRVSSSINKELYRVYKNFMIFTSSALQNNYPGRKISFLVIDKPTNKFIGMILLGSDIGDLADRDKYIGWNKESKYVKKRLNNLANAQVLVAVQPFGFNCLGGKLLARLVVTQFFRDEWFKEYNDILAGITTTSLYGQVCQYNGLSFWKGMGTTSGNIPINLPKHITKLWKDQFPSSDKCFDNIRINLLRNICRQLNIEYKSILHGFKRGIHYVSLYHNSNDFLQCKITEDKLNPIADLQSVEHQLEAWKKYAVKRFLKLQTEKRLKIREPYYDEMVGISFSDAKQKFLKCVNR